MGFSRHLDITPYRVVDGDYHLPSLDMGVAVQVFGVHACAARNAQSPQRVHHFILGMLLRPALNRFIDLLRMLPAEVRLLHVRAANPVLPTYALEERIPRSVYRRRT